MRKLIYGIGIFLYLLVLSSAFYQSYQVGELKAQIRDMEEENTKLQAENEKITVEAATAKGGFYLREQDGYVYVYEGDQLYEVTNILMESLPKSLQEEIKAGKYLESQQALYNFLENYSS
jgi:cell division protein FtsB